MTVEVICSFVSKRFDKPDNDYKIAVYRPNEGQPLTSDFVAKGDSLPLDEFLEITLKGNYVEDDNGRGPALIVSKYSTAVKRTRASVLGYLSSGAIKGIGKATALLIFERFGLDSVEVLEKSPQRLREVSGIGEKTMEMILQSYEENREILGLMQYLGQFNIKKSKAWRIVDAYGDKSLEIIREDIYHLCAVPHFGFITVDEMAQKMGLPMNTFPRVKAAAFYMMEQYRTEGHLYIEPKMFLRRLRRTLNHKESSYKFRVDELKPLANQIFQESKELIYKDEKIYQRQDYINERGFAERMALRLFRDRQRNPKVGSNLQIVNGSIALSPEQEKAARMCLRYDTCIVTGGPGTGKTTFLKAFLDTFILRGGKRDKIMLVAPTGRAARRMSESTGYQAFTAHKGFGLGSEEGAATGRKPSPVDWCEVVVMDESSMSDMWLSYQVLSRIGEGTKLVFVGDEEQLPSVGPGNVLRELLKVEAMPRVKLKQVFRHTAGSSIAINAKRIVDKQTELLLDKRDFRLYRVQSQDEAMRKICRIYRKAVEQVGIDQVQILTPQKKNGSCGANQLNMIIQRMFHDDPEADGKKHFDRYFCEGDLVIQTQNKNGVYNGDMGIVSEVGEHGVKVSFPGLDLERVYNEDTLSMLELAFSLTVHKAQGSEYPIIIMPVLREHAHMLTRNLFYTAITRGKRQVILVGMESAIINAIRKEDTAKRRTMLAERIDIALEQLEALDIREISREILKESA